MAEARRFAFVHLDVFARRPLEGNPLAVFPDARGLSDAETQDIAREMRLPETTFVFPRDGGEGGGGAPTRIFTVEEELPFAGHPTLGTAWVLRAASGASEVTLDLRVGPVPVRFRERDGELFGEMTQPELRWGSSHPAERVAAALGVEPSALDPSVPIQTVSVGNPIAVVPFRSLDALRRLAPDWARMEAYLRGTDARFFYLVCRQTEDSEAGLHARMVFYGGEDPATGSAAGPAGAWMVRHRWARPEQTILVEQGIEIHRPSRLFVRVGGTPDRPENVRVGGFCFEVIRGELRLPAGTNGPA